MRKLIYAGLVCIIIAGVLFLVFPPCDTKNYLSPYASTQFTPLFTKEKFNSIQKGMNLNEVENIIGKPFSIDTFSFNNKILSYQFNYSKKKGCNTWQVAIVFFDNNLIVKDKGIGWRDY